MTKNLLVTCLYSNLWESKIGGRPSRTHHYLNGLVTISQLEQDVIVYTSESEKPMIEDHLNKNSIKSNVKIVTYDLFTDKFHNYYQSKINNNPTDRCFEVMHNKIFWLENYFDIGYDNIYWIDCGLTHGGLFPIKYRKSENFADYFTCTLYDKSLFSKISDIGDRILICYCDQKNRLIEAKPNDMFFKKTPQDENCHIVGGFFGGPQDLMKEFVKKYKEVFDEMISFDILEREEHLITVAYTRNKSMFNPLKFTSWHHEDSDMFKYNFPDDKPFYKIFEEIYYS
jgi:hypothetical protein